jgi:AP endonuclease-2
MAQTYFFSGWNQKISARDTNYGTRVDYILVTKGLLPWIKHGDILPSLKGSDHCPIYVDLHDEITSADGASISLRQAMKLDDEAIRDPPRLASKYWDEYSGKQTMLSTFFGKRTVVSPESSVLPAPQSAEDPTPSPPEPAPKPSNETSSLKRKESIPTPATTSLKPAKKPRNKTGQTKLSTFFSSNSQPSSSNISSSTSTFTLKGSLLSSATPTSSPEAENSGLDHTVSRASTIDTGQQLEADYQFACQIASSQSPPQPSKSLKHHRSTSSSTPATTSKSTWSNLLAPLAPPKCVVHNEPAKELTVNKPGPNKGKKFFVCSR